MVVFCVFDVSQDRWPGGRGFFRVRKAVRPGGATADEILAIGHAFLRREAAGGPVQGDERGPREIVDVWIDSDSQRSERDIRRSVGIGEVVRGTELAPAGQRRIRVGRLRTGGVRVGNLRESDAGRYDEKQRDDPTDDRDPSDDLHADASSFSRWQMELRYERGKRPR